jgi:membrane peptidoglycan carboxypeptidase
LTPSLFFSLLAELYRHCPNTFLALQRSADLFDSTYFEWISIQMKRIFKYAALLLTALFVTTFTYSACSLYKDRQYTRTTIVPDLQNAQWRPMGGTPRDVDVLSRDLTPRQLQILVTVQDPGFFKHNGIDLSTPGAGLTTITQAIVKKLYFENFKPGIAKLRQSLIARFVVNKMISKADQLTIFLNTMSFGKIDGASVVGFESAAEAFYGLPLKELTEDQYICLVAMLVAPSTFHIIDHPDWNRDRTLRIKALIAGRYNPKGLMDQYYGELPQAVIDAGLPPLSYVGGAASHK